MNNSQSSHSTFPPGEDPASQRIARRSKYAALLEYIMDVGTPDGKGGYHLGPEAGRQMPGILTQNLVTTEAVGRFHFPKGIKGPFTIEKQNGIFYLDGRRVADDQIETIERPCESTTFDRNDHDRHIPGTPEFHADQYLNLIKCRADMSCTVSAAALHHLRMAAQNKAPIPTSALSIECSEQSLPMVNRPARPKPSDEPPVSPTVTEPKAVARLKPSHLRSKALYEWSLANVEGAEDLTYAQLLDKLTTDPRCGGEGLPKNAGTFGRYCRAAGVRHNCRRIARGPTRSVRRASEL